MPVPSSARSPHATLRPAGRRRLAVTLALVALVLSGISARAAECPVPSASHATIQAAVDDPACTDILLGAQAYLESLVVDHRLTLGGVSSAATTIQGQVRVLAGDVVLEALRVDTSVPSLAGRFTAALAVEAGASVAGADLVVVNRTLLFGDGFESGDTGGWSSTVP